jgi:HEAT repeat protein
MPGCLPLRNMPIPAFAIEALGALGDARAVPALIALLHDAATPADQYSAIANALGALNDKSAVPALFPLLTSTDASTRQAALHALSCFRDARAFDPITALLKDPDEGARAAAAYTLGFISGNATVTRLLSFLETEKADKPAIAACYALARLHADNAVPFLFKRYADIVVADRGDATPRVMGMANFDRYFNLPDGVGA